MKKLHFILLTSLLLVAPMLHAQKYMTKTGFIHFNSTAKSSPDKIEADNKVVNCALDIANGDFIFKVLMKSFQFEKALMQEHFNENYVESDKYPNASFTGSIVNFKEINFTKDGIYTARIEGDLTIHGITKKVAEKGTFEVKDGKIIGKAKFTISLKDYNISIPSAVANYISDQNEITIEVTLEKLK